MNFVLNFSAIYLSSPAIYLARPAICLPCPAIYLPRPAIHLARPAIMPALSQSAPQYTIHSLDFSSISVMQKFPEPSVFRSFTDELENKMLSCVYLLSCDVKDYPATLKFKDFTIFLIIIILDRAATELFLWNGFFLQRGESSGLACLHASKLRYDFKSANEENRKKTNEWLQFFHHTVK